MKRKGWKRRVLPVLLAVAMVMGSMDVTSFVAQAEENAYEATSGTHGATYDSDKNQVTFWVKDTDAFYSQINSMWFKEYSSYDEAAENHINNGGNFITEVGAFNFTENEDRTEKTYTVGVKSGTGAILYYINGEAGHARPDYEHIIVIGDGSGKGDSDNAEGNGNEGGSDTVEGEVIVASGVDLSGIVADGNAAAVNGWSAWTDKGVTAVGGKDTVTFTFPAEKVGYDYSLQFQQPDGSVTLTQGEYYTLTFTATSSIARFIEVCLGGSNYARHNDMVYKLPAGQATTISYVFAADSSEASKIQFLLGRQQSAGKLGEDLASDWANGHTLTISGVSLVKAGSAELAGANSGTATDKTALNELITECSTLSADDYTADSYKVLGDALTEAQRVADNADASKMDVDFTLTDLQIAKGNLIDAGYIPPADPVASTGALTLEDVIGQTYKSDSWGGDSNVQFKFNGTELVVTADSFGSKAWAVQLQEVNVTSTEENNVFEFDVVSTIDKNIVWKNETANTTETIELKANVPVHVARRITGKELKSTFDLTGGGAGTLTISNMKFGPEVSYYNFEEAVAAGDETFQFYVGNEAWAGYAQATGTASGTTYTMDVTDFGSADWGLQMILKGLVDVKTDDKYEIHAVMESSVDKTVTVKLGEVGNDSRALALETYELKAGAPLDIALTSNKANEDFTGTLYFACGNAKGTKGTIKVSNVYVTMAAATTEAAPALGAGRALDKANGFKVGENVVVTFPAESADWANAITSLKVSNRALTKGTDFTVDAAAGTITINAAAFTKQNVYTIEVEADGFKATEIKIPVYDADVVNEKWTEKWADEFNGTELDTKKWSYELGVRSGDDATSDAPIYWGNNEKQYYIKEAIEVKDGYLVITGNKLTDAVKTQYGVTDSTVQYTSGRIRTVTDDGNVLAATTYGRIEAKMILPGYQGYWPAFWMLPATDVYGTWASSGELDIMEAVGQNPGQVNGTIHFGGQWPNNINSGGVYTFPEGSSINEEHVYAVEWEPGEIRWYVDDVLYHVENNWYGMDANGEKYTYPAPYDEDFYILFNLAMSGNYVSNVLPKDDEMGKQMKVDYVRILMDENTDYDVEVTKPATDRDTESFKEYGEYVDLIKDKDFTTLADTKNQYGDGGSVLPGNELWWSAVNTGAGANATVAVVDGAAKIDVIKQGSNDYNVQLIQNVPLAKGYTYRVAFDAWTDVTSGRTIRVAPGGDCNHGWKSYDPGISPTITTTKKTYTFDFVMNSDSDPSVRLEMNLGGALGTVYIDNVSVIALTDEQLNESDENGAKEPLVNGEHIYNGTFDKGTGKLGYWTVEGTQGSTDNRNYTVKAGADGAKLIQTGLQLRADDEYKLTFDASTLGAGKVKMTLTSEDGTTVYAAKDYSLTTSTKSYDLGFTVPEGKGTDMGKLVIEFIGNGETVTIDNVSMMRLTDVQMEWDSYNLTPIAEGDTSGYSTYDEIWNWAENAISPTNIGNGETAFAIKTTNASENWKVLFQRKNVQIAKGMTYRIRYAIKSTAADSAVEVKMEDTSYSPCYDANLSVGTDWTYVDTTFTSTLAAAGDLKFCLAGVDSERTIYVKDISIEMEGIPVPQFAEGSEISTMKAGETARLNIAYNIKVQEKYKKFTYKSSDTNVVDVAADGTMIAKAEGTATITVTSVLGTEFTFDVKVTKDSGEPHTHTGGKATCTTKAKCTVCGESYGSVDKNNHAGDTEIRNAKEATYTAEGYTGDTYCKGCGAKIATGKTIPKKAHTHTGGKATCTTKAKCTVCGESYGSVDKNNHTGGTEVRGKVAATATKAGYTGDTYCKGCGAKLATGKTIPATGSTGNTGNTGNTGTTTPKNGWYEKNGAKYWYENGVKQGTEGRGKEIYDPASDAWYWLDAPNGVMAKSKDVYQESLAGDWGDYFNENGERCGKWVRYDENGHMVKGWQDTENGKYFFDDTYGTMAKGYATIDGVEYYFNPATGVLEQTIGEVPKNGWKTIDGKDYWYENSIRQGYSVDASYRGKEIYDPDSDAWYWLDNIQGGAKAVSKDVYQESLAGDWGDYTNADGERCGKWVRYDENGHMIKGWQTTDAGTYFFDYTYGTMAKGSANIEGVDYYFDPDTGIRQ